jgi:hypothetical protein
MKIICKILAYVELVLGITGSIFLSDTLGMRLNFHTLKLERDGTATFAILFSTLLSVITLWAILYAFSEILENPGKAKPTIITPICKPLSEPPKTLPTRPEVQLKIVKQVPENAKVNDENWNVYDAWKCPNCKRINDGSMETCICGIARST